MGLTSHLKATMLLAWPVIVGQLGHMVIATVDTIMIGHLGSRELAAASIGNGIFFLIAVIGIGVNVVISPLTAQALGANESDEALGDRLHQGLLVTFWLCLVSVVLLIGLTFAVPWMGQQPKSVPLAQDYLLILTASLLPMLFYLTFKHFLDGFEAVRPGMVIMGMMVLINIFLNWVLIHGNLGMPAMGLQGAGWATLISRIIGMSILAGYVIFSKRFGRYFDWKRLFRHKMAVIKEILEIGLPSGMQYFFEVGAFAGAVLLAGRISEQAQSAHQIAIQIASITYMFYMGISSAVSIRVGNALGRLEMPAIVLAAKAGLFAGLICVVVFISGMIGLKDFLPAWYIKEEDVVLIAGTLLLIAAVFQFFDGMQAIIMGALRGISDVNIPTGLTFVAYWIIGLPSAWFLSEVLDFGVQGIWYGLTLGLGFSAMMLGFRLYFKLRAEGLKSLEMSQEKKRKGNLGT